MISNDELFKFAFATFLNLVLDLEVISLKNFAFFTTLKFV